jgi:hypothetical protein
MTDARRRSLASVAVSSALFLGVSVASNVAHVTEAHAAPPKRPPPRGGGKKPTTGPNSGGVAASEAGKRLANGIALFKEKKYEEALKELELAYKLGKKPGALRLMAETQRQLQRYADAYASYEALLANHEGDLTPTEISDVQLTMGALELLTGTARVESDESDAKVTVDGRDLGTTPLAGPVRLDPGTHTFKASKEGREPLQREVTVKAQQTATVDLRWKPAAEPKAGEPEGDREPDERTADKDADRHENEAKRKPRDTAPSPHRGLYGAVGIFGGLPANPYPKIPCPGPPQSNCTSSGTFGGGAVGRFGYRLGLFSFEAALGVMTDRHQERLAYQGTINPEDPTFFQGNITRKETLNFRTLGVFAGVGPRITTDGALGFTFGITPGFSYKQFSLRRVVEGGVADDYSESASYGTFGTLVDAGVRFRLTETLRLSVGVFAWADFPGADPNVPAQPNRPAVAKGSDDAFYDVTLPSPTYTFASGPQIFVGPVVGVFFGK